MFINPIAICKPCLCQSVFCKTLVEFFDSLELAKSKRVRWSGGTFEFVSMYRLIMLTLLFNITRPACNTYMPD